MQEKNNQELDLMFKLKTLQQSLELEEMEHKATKSKLADKNEINQCIEEAKSEALKGELTTDEKDERGQSTDQNLILLKYVKCSSIHHPSIFCELLLNPDQGRVGALACPSRIKGRLTENGC